MTTTTPPQLLTADDLWRMPDRPRCELVKGELITMAPAGFHHGAVIARLTSRLASYVERNQLGVITGAETGFLISRTPDTVRGADIAFVSAANLPPGGPPTGYFPGAPDLAVEVVSPNDTVAEVEDKVDDYLRARSAMVWVANPRRRTVTVYRPDAPPVVLREADPLTRDPVVPGFTCVVAEIFA